MKNTVTCFIQESKNETTRKGVSYMAIEISVCFANCHFLI